MTRIKPVISRIPVKLDNYTRELGERMNLPKVRVFDVLDMPEVIKVEDNGKRVDVFFKRSFLRGKK